VDDHAAAEALRQFIKEVDDQFARWNGSHNPANDPVLQEGREHLKLRRPAIERIVETVEPGRHRRWEVDRGFEFREAREHALRAVGILESRAEVDAILGPSGPRLQAAQLHPWVWEAAARLWDGGHRRAALQAAATQVEANAQAKLDRYDLSGVELWRQAFRTEKPRPDQPRLRFSGFIEDTPNWISAHEGAMNFGVGCAQRIRNLVTHLPEEPEEMVALEQLAALSVLARWTEEAEVVTA
jgi:hypothetical protein